MGAERELVYGLGSWEWGLCYGDGLGCRVSVWGVGWVRCLGNFMWLLMNGGLCRWWVVDFFSYIVEFGLGIGLSVVMGGLGFIYLFIFLCVYGCKNEQQQRN